MNNKVCFLIIVIVALLYKLSLPIFPSDLPPSFIPYLFYLFVFLVFLLSAFIFRGVSLGQSERVFLSLILGFYFVIFLASFLDVVLTDAELEFDVFIKIVIILLVSLSGFFFGTLVEQDVASLLTKLFYVFVMVLLLKVFFHIGDNYFFEKRPLTMTKGVLALIFIWFITYSKFNLSSILITLAVLLSFYASGSRTTLFAMLFVLIFHFVSANKGMNKLVAFLVVLVALPLVYFYSVNNLESLGRLATLSLDGYRLEIWKSIFSEMFRGEFNWLIGRGVVEQLYVISGDYGYVDINTPHNTYVYLLYYSGLLGCLIGGGIIFMSITFVRRPFSYFMLFSLVTMLFNDSLLFPHSYSYVVDYWMFFFFISFFWNRTGNKCNL